MELEPDKTKEIPRINFKIGFIEISSLQQWYWHSKPDANLFVWAKASGRQISGGVESESGANFVALNWKRFRKNSPRFEPSTIEAVARSDCVIENYGKLCETEENFLPLLLRQLAGFCIWAAVSRCLALDRSIWGENIDNLKIAWGELIHQASRIRLSQQKRKKWNYSCQHRNWFPSESSKFFMMRNIKAKRKSFMRNVRLFHHKAFLSHPQYKAREKRFASMFSFDWVEINFTFRFENGRRMVGEELASDLYRFSANERQKRWMQRLMTEFNAISKLSCEVLYLCLHHWRLSHKFHLQSL